MCALFDSVCAPNLLRGSNQNKVQQKYATLKVLGSSTFQDDNMQDNVDVSNKQRRASSHASSGFDTDNPHNISSSVIKNDVPWVDQNGSIMEIGRGGKISVIDGVYYWIGHQPAPPKLWVSCIFDSNCFIVIVPKPNNFLNILIKSEAGDVYLYKSTSFGSNSWEFVRIIYDFSLEEGSASNCALSKYPIGSVEKYFIHCSLGVLFETFDGQPLESTEFVRQSKLNDPAPLPYRDYKWANCDTHVDGENLYFVVSRRSKTGDTVNSRVGMIYKFDSTWHSLTEVVAVWSWIGREAYDMIKNGEYFYLFASQTARWRQSRTFFLRSPTMEGFANATEEEVVMNPIWTNEIQSMGSQFRTIVEVENGKWLFGGSRHPDEDPVNWDYRYGRYLFAPLQFGTDNTIRAYWLKEFDWKTYIYGSEVFDEHDHGTTGHKSLFENKLFAVDAVLGGGAELMSCESTGTQMLR